MLSKLLPLGGNNNSNNKQAKWNTGHHHPIVASINIESPPCVLHGSAIDSSGAMLSGLLTLKTKDAVTVNSVSLTFVQKIQYHRPFVPLSTAISNCKNCKLQTTVLRYWKLQKDPKLLGPGSFAHPFSYLIPGSYPSSSHLGSNSQTVIKYELIATVHYMSHRNVDQKLQLVMPVPVTRSIPRGPDRNSLRVFPPTDLVVAAVLPNVVYPKSTFPLELKIDGVTTEGARWRMRKLSWRIEETSRVRNFACSDHKEELHKIEKETKAKEKQKSKNPPNLIKRYGDLAPQIRTSVSTPNNSFSMLPETSRVRENSQDNSAQPAILANSNGDIDDDGNEGNDSFIHPSDDALRQEYFLQQQRLREEQIKEELKTGTFLFTEEVRVIAQGDMKSGWKTDFSEDGKIELVTDIDCMGLDSGVTNYVTHLSTQEPLRASNKKTVNVACDMQDPKAGINVSHILFVEIVVAEEALQYSNGQPVHKSATVNQDTISNADQRLAELSPMLASRSNSKRLPVDSRHLSPSRSKSSKVASQSNGLSPRIVAVPTGAARVLRMQFRINMTERSGLGISWDEEVPPIYQDVKLHGPPSYDKLLPAYSSIENLPPSRSSSGGRGNTISDGIDSSSPLECDGGAQEDETLEPVGSPEISNVVSLDGNIPNQVNALTPRNTTSMGIRNISEVVDTDKITQ